MLLQESCHSTELFPIMLESAIPAGITRIAIEASDDFVMHVFEPPSQYLQT